MASAVESLSTYILLIYLPCENTERKGKKKVLGNKLTFYHKPQPADPTPPLPLPPPISSPIAHSRETTLHQWHAYVYIKKTLFWMFCALLETKRYYVLNKVGEGRCEVSGGESEIFRKSWNEWEERRRGTKKAMWGEIIDKRECLRKVWWTRMGGKGKLKWCNAVREEKGRRRTQRMKTTVKFRHSVNILASLHQDLLKATWIRKRKKSSSERRYKMNRTLAQFKDRIKMKKKERKRMKERVTRTVGRQN